MFRPLHVVTIALFGCSLLGCSQHDSHPRKLVSTPEQQQVEGIDAVGQKVEQTRESLYWQNEEAKSDELNALDRRELKKARNEFLDAQRKLEQVRRRLENRLGGNVSLNVDSEQDHDWASSLEHAFAFGPTGSSFGTLTLDGRVQEGNLRFSIQVERAMMGQRCSAPPKEIDIR